MPKPDPCAAALEAWLLTVLAKASPRCNLACIEWNEGWTSTADRKKGKGKQLLFSMSGFEWDGEEFDPEDPDHLEELSDPKWDFEPSCGIPLEEAEQLDLPAFVKRVLRQSKPLQPLLANRTIAFGPHDSDVAVVRPRQPRGTKVPESPDYFELHEAHGSNSIESYECGRFNERPLLDHNRIAKWPDRGIKLVLQKRARLLDFLDFYRGWVVCTELAAEMFREATDKIQVFPAPLFAPDGEKPVPGYCVVNLYEKLDCLRDEDVLPPDFRGEPKTFNASKGYRIVVSKLEGRDVFRLNYEYYRLVVSARFRERLEKAKITGLSWLRRRSVP